jgi:hypothetical protein
MLQLLYYQNRQFSITAYVSFAALLILKCIQKQTKYPLTVFARGVEVAKAVYGVPYHETPDIVNANSCPCDIDFWQSHKSLYQR